MNLEVSRSKLNGLFLLLDSSKLFTCTLHVREGYCIHYLPNSVDCGRCQCSAEHILGNMNIIVISQKNKNTAKFRLYEESCFFEGSTFIYTDRPSLPGRESFPRLALCSRYPLSQALPSLPFQTHRFFEGLCFIYLFILQQLSCYWEL